ncbi:MAG: GNAT family N-acetyltransferase [Burkholderiaceae bacterium]|nr:GNAT family N-acetyltransferase [Burkholderiaceae bacterium]
MEPLHLRQATIADLAEIMRLEQAGFAAAIQESAATFSERLAAGGEGCWVLAAPDQRLFGYLCAEFWRYQADVAAERFARDHSAAETHCADGEEIYVSSMVVDPVLRGSGWGSRLFHGALDAMRARHCQLRSAILIVHPEWLGARQIYRRAGFTEIGTVPAYFAAPDGASHAAIIMRREDRDGGAMAASAPGATPDDGDLMRLQYPHAPADH